MMKDEISTTAASATAASTSSGSIPHGTRGAEVGSLQRQLHHHSESSQMATLGILREMMLLQNAAIDLGASVAPSLTPTTTTAGVCAASAALAESSRWAGLLAGGQSAAVAAAAASQPARVGLFTPTTNFLAQGDAVIKACSPVPSSNTGPSKEALTPTRTLIEVALQQSKHQHQQVQQQKQQEKPQQQRQGSSLTTAGMVGPLHRAPQPERAVLTSENVTAVTQSFPSQKQAPTHSRTTSPTAESGCPIFVVSADMQAQASVSGASDASTVEGAAKSACRSLCASLPSTGRVTSGSRRSSFRVERGSRDRTSFSSVSSLEKESVSEERTATEVAGLTLQRLALRKSVSSFGLAVCDPGSSQSPEGSAVTAAAISAIRDAIHRGDSRRGEVLTTLRRMMFSVKVGVPPSPTPSPSAQVDLQSVTRAISLSHGEIITIEVVPGGLAVGCGSLVSDVAGTQSLGDGSSSNPSGESSFAVVAHVTGFALGYEPSTIGGATGNGVSGEDALALGLGTVVPPTSSIGAEHSEAIVTQTDALPRKREAEEDDSALQQGIRRRRLSSHLRSLCAQGGQVAGAANDCAQSFVTNPSSDDETNASHHELPRKRGRRQSEAVQSDNLDRDNNTKTGTFTPPKAKGRRNSRLRIQPDDMRRAAEEAAASIRRLGTVSPVECCASGDKTSHQAVSSEEAAGSQTKNFEESSKTDAAGKAKNAVSLNADDVPAAAAALLDCRVRVRLDNCNEEKGTPSTPEEMSFAGPQGRGANPLNESDRHNQTDSNSTDSTPKEKRVSTPSREFKSFPVTLHRLLDEVMLRGEEHIVSWEAHGRSFVIRKPKEFVEVVLPQYFVSTELSCFLRQLEHYGFHRLNNNETEGEGFFHDLFVRGNIALCHEMEKYSGCNKSSKDSDDEADSSIYVSAVTSEVIGDGSALSSIASATAPLSPISDKSANGASVAYKDYCDVPVSNVFMLSNDRRKQEGGSHGEDGIMPSAFPLKVHAMLDRVEADGHSSIVGWKPHGRCFMVHKPDEFVTHIMPKYFRQTKYSSFQRQLHIYGFRRMSAGPDKGSYYHELFLRNMPHLCDLMVRTRINGKGCRRPCDPQTEPDFYQMKWLTREQTSER